MSKVEKILRDASNALERAGYLLTWMLLRRKLIMTDAREAERKLREAADHLALLTRPAEEKDKQENPMKR